MKNVKEEITNLLRKHDKVQTVMHYVNRSTLRAQFKKQKANRAVGVDGVTKGDYRENLEENLDNLVEKMKSFSYKPKPVRRVYINKDDGSKRPLGIPSFEDKLVQGAMKDILEAVYEPKFMNYSYGFRRGKNCHKAIQEIHRIVMKGRTNYVVDADIKGFFDNVDHEWLMKFLEHDIQDKNYLRYIKRLLKSGIMEGTELYKTENGVPQGGVISPVLANVYLHYVLDIWFEKVVKRECEGMAMMVRYADDFVCMFEYKEEAEEFYRALKLRLEKFNLKLAEDKSKIIEFGRYARGKETFDFLGFTHINGISRKGNYNLIYRTSNKKMRIKKQGIKNWIKRNMHMPIKEMIEELNAKLRGHFQYYGISSNYKSINNYHWYTMQRLFAAVNRRSQRRSYTSEKFGRILKYHGIIYPKIHFNVWRD